MIKVKDLKEFIQNFNDEDDVAIEIKETLYDCYCYDDEFHRKEGQPCLVIAME